MSKIVFSGCSFTAGNGWNPENIPSDCKDSPFLWVNLCHKNIEYISQFDLVNLGIGGASNTDIFENTIECISQHKNISMIIVEWTSMPRYTWKVGLELWETAQRLTHRGKNDHHCSNGSVWTQDYLRDLSDRLLVTHHLHWEILKVLRYSHILENICNEKQIDLFFVNGICPWDENYFVRLQGEDILPESYTKFTKEKILEIEHRNDNDIFQLYKIIHDHYDQYKISQHRWINLYESFVSIKTDVNHDGRHPGKISNYAFFQLIKNFIDTKFSGITKI